MSHEGYLDRVVQDTAPGLEVAPDGTWTYRTETPRGPLVSLPLTDAETTLMPELHHTVPMAEVQTECAWCGIRLAAIPDAPKPVYDPEGKIVHVHPGGCVAAYRQAVR